jgi:hypothetical protein
MSKKPYSPPDCSPLGKPFFLAYASIVLSWPKRPSFGRETVSGEPLAVFGLSLLCLSLDVCPVAFTW